MKFKHLVIASAVSCSLGSLAFAQQAQESAPPEQQREGQSMGQDQTQGQAMEQQPSAGQGEQGQESAMEAKKQGAHSPPGTQQSQETIRQVQKKLNDEGFSAGPVDGKWGPKTQAAVKKFQEKKGIDASGQLDEKTLAELNVEAQPSAGAAGAAGSAGEGAQEGAAGATGATEQPGQESSQQPSEKEAQQPGQSPSQ